MLKFDRTTYVTTLLMACWLGLSVVMGWWLTCTVTVAALGRVSWFAHRAWQAERRAEEARTREGLELTWESIELCRVLVQRNADLFSEAERATIQGWPARIRVAAESPG